MRTELHQRVRPVRRGLPSFGVASTALSIALLNTSCMWIPYDHAVVVPEPQPRPTPGLQLAGGANEALLYAESHRLEYYNNLQRTSAFRSATASLAIGLTGWGLYNALKPTGDPVYIGDRRRTVRLATGIAALYAGQKAFVNEDHEKTWAQGYRALTCLMFQASPLLMTQADSNRPTSVAPGRPPEEGDVERLRSAMLALEKKILSVNQLVARYDARVDALLGTDAELKLAGDYFRARSRDTRNALEYAKTAWRDAGTLLDTVDQAGYRIRAEVGLIVAVGNEAIQAKQVVLPDSAQLFTNGNAVATGLAAIKSIGVETEADQADLKVTRPADAQAAADVPSLTTYAIRPVAWRTEDAATAPQTGAPALVASPVTEVAPKAPEAPKKPAPKPPVKAAADRIATAASLKDIRDKLDKAITKIENDDLAAKNKKTADALDRSRVALKKELYAKAHDKLSCANQLQNDEGCLDKLLVQTEKLYALRRPVAAALVNFRERTRQVADAPECADLSQLHVSPGGPIRVDAGSTLEFIISQRLDDVSPQAVLQGPTQDESGAKLTLAPISLTKMTKMTLVLGEKMETQRLRVIVSDAHRATQIITVTVVKKPEKKAATADAAPKEPAKAVTSS